MYLSGVRFLADTPGARYTLRDLNEDGISELFVSAGDHTAVYVYDKALDQAVRSSEYDSEISSLVSDDSAVWVDASQWTDGTICGVVLQTGDPGVRADYYASANYDWLSQAHVKNQGDSVDQTAQYVSAIEKKRQMFEDRDLYLGEDIQRIRDLYDIATDWDRREKEGIEPVRKYLDAIDRIDSSYLSVDPGSSYLDAFAAVTVNTKKHNREMVGQERRKGEWRYDLSPDVAPSADNCFYYGAYNQFFILNGFLNDRTYRKDMSIEQKLGTIGEVIGHELTHGFDPNGIQYDKNGNKVATDEDPSGWMPEEDYRAYNERAGKLAEYFSSFIPFPYNRCDGTIYQGEAAADITGMETGLKVASGIEGFDYDLYFRSHAKLWSKQSTLVVEQGDIFDEHPLYYLRINATCQQFEEFHKTYDIKEGDRMYLAPEDRICIW